MSSPPQPSPIVVTLVEDDPDYLGHLSALLRGTGEFRCAGAYPSAEAAARGLKWEQPDVILLDLELPGASGTEAISLLPVRSPRTQILALTFHDEPAWLLSALEAGVMGYLLKPVPPVAVLEAIRQVHAGGSPMSGTIARKVLQTFQQQGQNKLRLAALTSREVEVLELLCQGFHNHEIAARLSISPLTVGTHVHHIYEKLQVRSRAAAASLRASVTPGSRA